MSIHKTYEAERITLRVLLIFYFTFNLTLLLLHEPWRDEANAWLFARDCSIVELFQQIHYQGHPCLWYLILMPFAKLGFPMFTMGIISLVLMTIAAGLFLFRINLPVWSKAVVIFSPIFSYFYPVISRNYCLIPLLIMLFLITYPKKDECPMRVGIILALMVQADTIVIPMAGVLSLMWLWQGVRERAYLNTVKGLIWPLLSVIIWILEFLNVSESPHYGSEYASSSELLTELKNYGLQIIGRITGINGIWLWMVLLSIIGLVILLSINMKAVWPLMIFCAVFGFETVFGVMVYGLHIWHYICIPFAIIVAVGIWGIKGNNAERVEDSKNSSTTYLRIISGVILSIFALLMFINWTSDAEPNNFKNAVSGLYSDSTNTARFVRKNIPEGSIIVTSNIEYASSVVGQLPNRYEFIYAGTMEKATYSNYIDDDDATVISFDELRNKLAEQFPEAETIYILDGVASSLVGVDESKVKKLYETMGETAKGEYYTVYQLKNE